MNRIGIFIFSIIIIWGAVSVGMIAQNVYSGGERSISSNPVQITNSTSPNFSSSTGFAILEIIEYTIYAWAILFIISLILYFRSTLKLLFRAIMSFLGLFILIGIVYILSVLISSINYSTSSNINGMRFSSQEITGTLPVIAGIAVLSFLFIYMLSKNFYIPVNNKNETINRKISDMIKEIKFGNDVRSSIMKVYYDLSNLLKNHGIIESDYLTAREFENMSLEKIHFDSRPFEIIINLFEEARYSTHQMTEEQRNMAIKALESIKEMLEGIK